MLNIGMLQGEGFNIRPFTYLGSKRKETQAIWNIIKSEAKDKPFTDVFGGSAAVSSAFLPYVSKVIYNDKQKLIPQFLQMAIDAYRNKNFEAFWSKIASYNPESRDDYFSLRETFNNEGAVDPVKYYILINCCTSCLIRWNVKKGTFTQAYSGKSLKTSGYRENLLNFCKLWTKYQDKWTITSKDFRDIEPEGFIYLDPPYSNAYNSYLAEKWSDEPLIEWIEKYEANHKIAISGMFYEDDPLSLDCKLLNHFREKGWNLHIITDNAFNNVCPSDAKTKVENLRQKKDRSKCHDVLVTNF